MSAGELDEAEASVRAAEGPGHRLRQARLARGLEIERVANQLHLTEPMIEALERDDFAQMPSPVFVKGYISNYGRLLGLPADPLLAAYARLQPGNERPSEPVLRTRPMPKRLGGNRSGYLLSGLILVGILGGGGYWVKTRLQPGMSAWQTPETALDAEGEPSEELPPSLQAFLEEQPEPELAVAEPPLLEPAELVSSGTHTGLAQAAEQSVEPPASQPEPAPTAEPPASESGGGARRG